MSQWLCLESLDHYTPLTGSHKYFFHDKQQKSGCLCSTISQYLSLPISLYLYPGDRFLNFHSNRMHHSRNCIHSHRSRPVCIKLSSILLPRRNLSGDNMCIVECMIFRFYNLHYAWIHMTLSSQLVFLYMYVFLFVCILIYLFCYFCLLFHHFLHALLIILSMNYRAVVLFQV